MNSILPFSVAVLLFGQTLFIPTKLYLGVEHPSWLLWSIVLVFIPLKIIALIRYIKITNLDVAMLVYIAVIFISYAVSWSEIEYKSFTALIAFTALSYASGRLLSSRELKKFFKYLIYVAATSFFVILIGLIQINEEIMRSDRINNLFNQLNISDGGSSTISHASVAFGALIILQALILYFAKHFRLNKLKSLFLIIFIINVYIFVLIGLRVAVLASLLTCIVIVLLASQNSTKGFLIISVAIVIGIFYLSILPDERYEFLSQLSVNSITINLNEQECAVYGDAISTRFNLYISAIRIFLDNIIFGVGVGNFSVISDCGSNLGLSLHPHSTLFQNLSELGLIGSVPYLVFIYLVFFGLYSSIKSVCMETKVIAFQFGGLLLFFLIIDIFSGYILSGYHFFMMAGVVSSFLAKLKNRIIV